MGIADRKARNFKRREEDILQAALDLFSEKGVEFVTIEMIAERAEIGKGTIYKHFSSKSEIFGSLIIRQSKEVFALLTKIKTDAPIIVQMKQVLRLFWDMNINNMGKYAVYRKCEQLLVMDDLTPDVLTAFTKTVNEKNRRVKVLIQQGIKEQIFKDEPVENLTAAAIGLVLGVFDIILAGGIKPSEELYSLMENMILKGFMR
ncbi:MAG: TetR/AcrR family transcriptional regulator [Desulfobacteraceae bacterium]|nr:TetR/AcrR family transcriptional regulator [Desulfobacteraceae bacterium]